MDKRLVSPAIILFYCIKCHIEIQREKHAFPAVQFEERVCAVFKQKSEGIRTDILIHDMRHLLYEACFIDFNVWVKPIRKKHLDDLVQM